MFGVWKGEGVVTLLDRVKQTANGARILFEWLGDDQKVVDKELAQSRADICKRCPKNQPGSIFTKAVAWAIKEQTDLKNDLQLRVEGEKSLHACQICTCWLRLKIWLPIEKLRKEETDEEKSRWPTWCWLRNEP